ncbi:MAG: NAD-dependent deacylase [Vicinamibacteria bacterium]
MAGKLRNAQRVLCLTGAGVSAESGVPTFRGAEGLWRKFRSEELATPSAFARDPKLVWEWYDWRRQRVAACAPNAGHRALAALQALSFSFDLVTQNVDGLHRLAGSDPVWELHGSLWGVRCSGCSREREDRRAPLPEIPPRCECGGLERPSVVWFGEPLPGDVLSHAFDASAAADVFLVVGTSALVHPAASLPAIARERGAFVVEVNPGLTPLSASVDVRLAGPSAEILPRVVEAI